MVDEPSHKSSRRSVLKKGAVLAGTVALAGCTGQDGGGGGDGSSGDGGDGSSGDGGDGGSSNSGDQSTGGSSPTEIIAAVPPTGWWAVLRKLGEDNGYFEEAAEEVGANVEFTFENTWDDVPTWVTGKADIAQFGTLEASRIGPRRDIDITIFGKNTPLNFGPMVQTGGPYDPETTGSVEATVDKFVDESAKFGIGSWGGADATSYDVAMGSAFDYRFQEEGGDFNVVTAGYFTIGKLVADGQLDAGSSGEGMGAAPQMMAGDVKPAFWLKDLIPRTVLETETKWGFPTMQNLVCRTELYENNQGAVETYFEAQKRALEELRTNPVEVITQSDAYIETMGAGSQEEAEFIVDYGINLNGIEGVPAPEHASVYETAAMSDEYVETQTNFIDRVAELGLTESNWQDYVQHVQF